MKSNWCTLPLFLSSSYIKYLRVLIDDIGYHVYPSVLLFCKSHLTTILNFNLSIIPSYCIFAFYTSMHGVTGYPFLGSYITNFWFLIMFLISFMVAFIQVFLASVGNLKDSWVLLWNGTLMIMILLMQTMNYLIILKQP